MEREFKDSRIESMDVAVNVCVSFLSVRQCDDGSFRSGFFFEGVKRDVASII